MSVNYRKMKDEWKKQGRIPGGIAPTLYNSL